jgi:hypothetical protein
LLPRHYSRQAHEHGTPPREGKVAPRTTLRTTWRGAGQRLRRGTVPSRMRRPLLERVDAFMAAHPGMSISPPPMTLSGLWEVRDDGGTAQWDNGFAMMDDLERRYARDDRSN